MSERDRDICMVNTVRLGLGAQYISTIKLCRTHSCCKTGMFPEHFHCGREHYPAVKSPVS